MFFLSFVLKSHLFALTPTLMVLNLINRNNDWIWSCNFEYYDSWEVDMIRIIANDGMDKQAAKKLISLGYDLDMTHYEGETLEAEILKTEVLIVRSATKVRKHLIDVALKGRLKLIIRAGVGIDNIDHTYAEENGIAVRNTPKASSTSVAELTLAHMFTLARHLHCSNVTMREGQWNKKYYKGFELSGKTLGLIGFGRIARATARKAAALGMNIVYTQRRGVDHGYPEYEYMPLEDLLASSDFVSLHLPWTKGQDAILATKELDMMKPTAYVINTSRGGAICEDDLLQALTKGTIAGAGIDVFNEEPSPNKALYTHPHVSVTPHIGGSTNEAQARIGEEIISLVQDFF